MTTNKAQSIKRIKHAVDYWLIGPMVTEHITLAGCTLAMENKFACITVKPCYLRSAVSHLRGSNTAVGTIVGYPDGARTRHVKIAEVKHALAEGAQELSLFLNLGYLLEGREDAFTEAMQELIGLVHMNGAITKTILDCQYLSDEQLLRGTNILINSQTDLIYYFLDQSSSIAPTGLMTMLKDNMRENLLGIVGNLNSKDDLAEVLNLGCARIGFTELPAFLK